MNFLRPYAPSRWTLCGITGAVVKPGTGIGTTSLDEYADLCAIEFNDDGSFIEKDQLDTAQKTIVEARQDGGVIVMVFVHGWKHDAEWDDPNFASFRRMVRSMSLRERERYRPDGRHIARRVVGIYIGWQGFLNNGLGRRVKQMLQLTYKDRDDAARTVAASSDFGQALRDIAKTTKTPAHPGSDNSPLILAGHSMGGLILENAMTHWVTASNNTLPGLSGTISNPLVSLTHHGVDFAGPDLVLLINPASLAGDTEVLMTGLETGGWRKQLNLDHMNFEPPLVVSVTSDDDNALKRGIPLANLALGSGWKRTAGFTPSMHTHRFTEVGRTLNCLPVNLGPEATDFDQRWHCLSIDALTRGAVMPTMHLALPDSTEIRQSHTQYIIEPMGNQDHAKLLWVVQVPDAVIGDHNDIFNPAAASLFLALFQISGAVVSIIDDWESLL